jgi:hypothetical protein
MYEPTAVVGNCHWLHATLPGPIADPHTPKCVLRVWAD